MDGWLLVAGMWLLGSRGSWVIVLRLRCGGVGDESGVGVVGRGLEGRGGRVVMIYCGKFRSG